MNLNAINSLTNQKMQGLRYNKGEEPKQEEVQKRGNPAIQDTYVPSQAALQYEAESTTAPSDTVVTDPSDPTKPNTYEPDAWLKDYYSNNVDETSEETFVDKTDYTNAETYDPKAWLAAYKDNKIQIAQAEALEKEEEEDTTVGVPEDLFEGTTEENTDGTGESTEGTSASDFANITEYFDYLKATYEVIERDNLDIPETLLEQAMNDPKKEEELLAFLKEMGV